MPPDELAALAERRRVLSNSIVDTGKLILRHLLPHVDQLQKGNAHFSPRLMQLMLERGADKLPEPDRVAFRAALEDAEDFGVITFDWVLNPKDAAPAPDRVKLLRDAVPRLEKHAANVSQILARISGSR